MEVTWDGREVTRQPQRALVAALALLGAALGALGFVVAMILLVVTLPLTIPMDLLLRKCFGRRGFYTNDRGHVSFTVGPGGFRRA